ncbi:MAG: hypothetical protein PF574_02575, partial [Candidatus Delongbacteria bacterium]|nr:hypothetical protein [Candidatus Delongbacteria bacterium]
KKIIELSNEENTNIISISNDGEYFIEKVGKELRIIGSKNNRHKVRLLISNIDILQVVCSSDGKYIAVLLGNKFGSSSEGLELLIYNTLDYNKEYFLQIDYWEVLSIAFLEHNEGIYLLIKKSTTELRKWNFNTNKYSKNTIQLDRTYYRKLLSPKGNYLASSSSEELILINTLDNSIKVKHKERNIISITFSDEEGYIYILNSEGELSIIELKSFNVIKKGTIDAKADTITLSPNLKFAALFQKNSKLCSIIDLDTFQIIDSLQSDSAIQWVEFSHKNKYLFIMSNVLKRFLYLDQNDEVFLEHLFYIYFNSNIADIKLLNETLHILTFSKELNKEIVLIINSITNMIGKNSKSIRISKGNNTISKDIEIKK